MTTLYYFAPALNKYVKFAVVLHALVPTVASNVPYQHVYSKAGSGRKFYNPAMGLGLKQVK